MRKNGLRIGCLLLCMAILCCGCGKDGADVNAGKDGTTTLPTETTTTIEPMPQTTLAPTTTQKNESGVTLVVNCPDGKQVDPELLGRLKSAISKNKDEISFYYKDLERGYSIEYRADTIYQTASVIKAPYVKYLLASGVDLNQKLKMTQKQGGSKYIDEKPLGTEFTVKELMEYAIRYSDNTAYYMLNEAFGFKGFNEYAKSLGVSANATRACVLQFPRPRFGYLSARDAGLYFEDIARYIKSDTANAKMLKTWLTSTTIDGMLADALGGTYEVAHKYGEQGNQAYHDAAIVYASKPYVLSILTTLEPYAKTSDKTFADIALLVDSIQAQMYTKSNS